MSRIKLYGKLWLGALTSQMHRRMLGKNAFAIISQTSTGLFATSPTDWEVGKGLRTIGVYGEEELERVYQYLGPQDEALVVGSHVGVIVVPMAKRCKRLVAIEANPETYKLLKINLLLNEVNNVETHNIAASDKEETLEFVASKNNPGGSKRMPKIRAFEYFYDSPQTIRVPASALDDYLKDRTFSVIFMDIEGSEYFALKGMQRILQGAKALFVEYLPHHLRNVSSVSPQQFVDLIAPHFDKLYIPSKNLSVQKSEFLPMLQTMFDRDEGDEGIVFSKM